MWAGAEAFVEDSSHPGDINQALIELGSTVCKVREPACGDCPLRPWCRAYQKTQPDPDPVGELSRLLVRIVLNDVLTESSYEGAEH